MRQILWRTERIHHSHCASVKYDVCLRLSKQISFTVDAGVPISSGGEIINWNDGQTANSHRVGVFHKRCNDNLFSVAIVTWPFGALRFEFIAKFAGIKRGRVRVFFSVFRCICCRLRSTCWGMHANEKQFEVEFIYFSFQREPHLSDPHESSISEIHDALDNLINAGQHAWAPHISGWSLRTLGILSKKYNRFENRGNFELM